jgi:hypothetical protein
MEGRTPPCEMVTPPTDNSKSNNAQISVPSRPRGKPRIKANVQKRTKLVQLLVVPDSQLQVSGNDTGLLVVSGGVTGELENFSGKVLEDGSEVDGGTSSDTF